MLSGDRSAAEQVISLYEQFSGEQVEFTADQQEITLELPEYSAIEAAGEPAPAAVRERLLWTISAACDTLTEAGADVSAESYTIENVYTLPIKSAFEEFSTDAVVSLLLALLVDWLSLAAAVIWARKGSVLTAKTTVRAAASDERFFERNVAAALQLGIFSEGGEFSGDWDEKQLSERLAGYICRFTAADFAAEQGCTLLAERSDLREYELLTAFLCQCGYAKLLSAQELNLLSGGNYEQDGVLLKTKFLMWVSEKSGKAV